MFGLNPWVLLGATVLWAASCAYSYISGSKHAADAAKAAYAVSLQAKIAAAHAQGVADVQAEAKESDERQKTRIEYRDRIQKVTEVIHADPTGCPLPDGYRVRLNGAIDAANTPLSANVGKVQPAAEVGK